MVASMCLGVLSIMTCPLCFISIPAAGLSILFAILSKGGDMRMEIMPKAGIVTSVLGACLSFAITGTMIALILFSPEYRRQLNEAAQSMYGMTMDDMMIQSYGISMEDLASKVTGAGK
ncbi:MAG: hypothetical protein IK078_00015 [Lachnospiraceae bacterium]|nr:hypothetical protein [Lachnospiraceae bacterium]